MTEDQAKQIIEKLEIQNRLLYSISRGVNLLLLLVLILVVWAVVNIFL
jgi:hypothetical protein